MITFNFIKKNIDKIVQLIQKYSKQMFYFIFVIIVIFFIGEFTLSQLFKKTVKVGVLYTTEEGPMAENERRLYNILIENIDYYNKIQNRLYLEKYVFHTKSTEESYIEGINYLIDKDVAITFGCWRSADRKAILPIIEEKKSLVSYPVQYEGNECSENVIYLGSCPNQQIDVGVEFCIKNVSKRVVLIGSDYVFPRTANEIVKRYIENMDCELLDEIYVSMTETEFKNIARKIVSHSKNVKDKILIVNTINGDSNKHFFEAMYNEFDKKYNVNEYTISMADSFPILSFSLTENDIYNYKNEWVYNHYFVWNFCQSDQSFDTLLKKNINNDYPSDKLITNFKKKDGIVDDPTYHAFLGLYFFITFLQDYDGDFDSKSIRTSYENSYNVKRITPTGFLSIRSNNHLEQPVYILRANEYRRYDILYRTPIEIDPNPWFNKFAEKQKYCHTDNHLGNFYLL